MQESTARASSQEAGADLLAVYRADGHVTVPDVFPAARMDEAIADAVRWGDEALERLSVRERRWYVDEGARGATVLRKLDNPHTVRASFAALARDRNLTDLVESLIGPGISVYFSQLFFKPPHGGGPKPAHQDNFYFGPSDPEGVITAWIALDDADEENGCLSYGRATHLRTLLPHAAPEDRPFDLQISDAEVARLEMRAAPVPKGGVSFHHGGTVHRSADNRSHRWRRACAFHYVRNSVVFDTPALPYDDSLVVRIT